MVILDAVLFCGVQEANESFPLTISYLETFTSWLRAISSAVYRIHYLGDFIDSFIHSKPLPL